ncbi:MAG: MBL fold metallo-hydrolase, partial [Eubacteriales bacterium]
VNNSSIVIKMTLGGKTVMFLGDLGVEAGEKLLGMYGEKLKSDYCQMAHHGQNGVTREVYAAVAPECCLWCTPQWLWDNNAGKGYNTHCWQTIIVRAWMDELGVSRHYAVKDGDQHIDL